MKRLSIGIRLAVWYFVSAAAILVLFAAGSWFALRRSLYHSIDRDLRYRLAAVEPFIESHGLHSREQFARVFANSSDSSIVGVFVQITDDDAKVIYESDVLASHRVPVLPRGAPDGGVGLMTAGDGPWPVRAATKRIEVGGEGLTIHVVEPLRDVLSALREYTLDLGMLVPLALLATTTVGYWVSRRALAPVEQIRKQADAIDPADLTTRLELPEAEDELARLTQTLNAMLARIESGFRAVQQFTADASHELRAPLALMITAGEVSLRRERPREELVDALQKMVREAHRMAKLVDDLLGLARGDAQSAKAEMASVDLTAILSELVREMGPAAAAKGLQLNADFEGQTFSVWGIGSDLRRLFLILIDNAIKYTEAGFVRLEVRRDVSEVCVKVCDSGIGIEPVALPHVFDRFWRADKARSRSEGGSGLGLALGAQIVRQHGGTISAESEVGRGSIFTVWLQSGGVDPG